MKILLEDKKAVYTPECIECGHCVAVCPRAAVAIPEYDMEDVEEYDKDEFSVDPEHFLHAVKFRRSIRSYKDQPLEKEKLEKILQAATYNPAAINNRSCRFIALSDEPDSYKPRTPPTED